MDNKISGRQAGAWCFCALSVPTVLTAAKLGWGWALASGAIAAVYFYLTQVLSGEETVIDLTALSQKAFGKTGGRGLLFISGAFTLLCAADVAGQAGAAFPDGTARLAGPVILLLAALGGRKGIRGAAGICGVVSFFLFGMYAILAICMAGQVKLLWLRPTGSKEEILALLPQLLLPCCMRYLPGRSKKIGKSWLVLLAIGPAAAAAGTAGCLSPKLAKRLPQPFYTLSQSLSLFDTMERFEPLVSAALFLGLYALESLLLEAALQQIGQLLSPQRERKELRWYAVASLMLLQHMTGEVPQMVWALGAAIFWGLAPILTQLIVAIKKD